MANLNITVQDGNNINVEVTPVPRQTITLDKGVAGVGIESVTLVYEDPIYFLEFTYTNGTTELVQLPAIASGVVSFNTRIGVVTLTSQDVTTALGYTPPTPTGTGATGTWAISVSGNAATATNVPYSGLTGTVPTWNQDTTGNAATVTNGVYTTGSYSDPSWLTALAGAKIVGDIAGNAGTVTNGVYTTDVGTVTNTMLAGSIANDKLVNSAITINGTSTSLGGSVSVGTVTSVAADAGTGISVSGSPITTSGTLTITNTAPDQIVSLTGAGTTAITGTYPNFTITSDDQFDGTVTSVAATAGTGISVSGSPITTSGTLTITNTAPDQVVSITGAGTSVVTGTYPNFTVTSDDQFDGTVTSVGGTGSVNGITLTGTVTSSGNLTLGGALTGVDLTTQVTGVLPIANGGTNATTASGARTSLGLGTSAVLDAAVALGTATLDAGGTVPLSQIPASIQGGLNYQGTWNASTNTPTLTSSVGSKGHYYAVSVAGSTNLNGITDWNIGDLAVYDGTAWQKIDNTDAVTSVNGFTGSVVLTTTNVAEGTNEYFTTARARSSVSAGTAITYDNVTGVITNAAPDQIVALTGAGTTTVSGTYPNFTISSADSKVGDVVGPTSATDNAITRYDGTTGKLIQNSTITIDDNGNVANANSVLFDTTPATLPTTEGSMYWDADKGAIAFVMQGGDVVQEIGESQYLYIQASANITKGQVVMFTGAIGGSGTPTGAPATGLTDGTYIIGIAAEDITSGTSGFVQTFGILKPVNTTGFATGTVLWYDPTVAGGLTSTKPVAPNIKVQIAAVTAGNSNGGALIVRVTAGSELGSTDSNVLFGSLSGGNLIAYDATNGYWKNINLTDGTAISITETAGGAITITNTAPDQVVSITGSGTTTVTGTYPNFTVTSDDQFDGTVTSVAATAGTGISVSGSPITSSGSLTITNTAPDQIVSLTASTGISTSGTYPDFTITNTAPDQTVSLTGAGTTSITGTYPNFTITSNDQFDGTVTSVAATAGTGISVTGSPITSSGTLTITNTAPDQTVVLTAGTGISTSGTYPNFTITNTSPSLGGDVVGAASSTDNAVARYDGTTGKIIQNSAVTIADTTGNMAGVGTLGVGAITTSGALTYGGVTLNNAVTGTGNMVLSTSPTLVTPALGTPASGVVTNLTGTASININGTVGATTPNTGAFTTLSSTGNTTLGDATSDLITANARFNTDLVPSTDNARDLGTSALKWKQIYATTFTENGSPVVVQTDIGTAPNEIPLNQYLGNLAYMSSDQVVLNPAASAVPSGIGDMVFQLTSDTSLVVKVKGSDGTIRSATLTLA